jgi:hypothetical protein
MFPDLPLYQDKDKVTVGALQMQNLRLNDRNSFPYKDGTLTFWSVAAEYPEIIVEEKWVPRPDVLTPPPAPGWYFVVNQSDGSKSFMPPDAFDAQFTAAKSSRKAPKEIKVGHAPPTPEVAPLPPTPLGPVAVQEG